MEIKKLHTNGDHKVNTHKKSINPQKPHSLFLFLKTKALIIDLFMIYVPILYVVTYLILGGKEEFQNSQWAVFGCVLLYGIIDSLFCSIASQTPGMRAQNLILKTQNGSKPNFLLAFVRFFLWIFSLGFGFGFVFSFLRRDKQTFHDLICKTIILNQSKKI